MRGVFEICAKGDTTLGDPHKLDRYPFRKMRKSQEQYRLIFFLRWLLNFLNMWLPGGLARGGQGVLSVQKNKEITRTVPILK